MLDNLIVIIMAKVRLKKYLWPSHKDPYFIEKIRKLQKNKNRLPPNRYLRGVGYRVILINNYPCYELFGPTRNNTKKILYIHGGAFVFPLLSAHWRFIAKLVRGTGQTVVVPTYPLVPDCTYKQIHKHLKRVYTEVLQTALPQDVTIIGDSAGGNLAIVLPLLLSNKIQPKHVIALSPVVDLRASDPMMDVIEPNDPLLPLETIRYLLPSYYKGTVAIDPLISPLFADFANYSCKLTITNGGKDILSPEIDQFHRKLLALGKNHDYIYDPNMPHAWPLLPLYTARRTNKEILHLIGE